MMIWTCLGDSKLAALQPLTDPWEHCLNRIGSDIPQQQFNTWIRPLQAQWQGSGLILAAPNRFIRDFVTEKYVPMIATYLLDIVAPASAQVSVTVVGGDRGADRGTDAPGG
jgi:chromosomal replication initiator protein